MIYGLGSRAFDEGADAETERADVVDIINLENGEVLVVACQNTAYFVEDEGIGSATETGQFDHVQTGIVGVAYHVSSLEDTVGVRPLAERVDLAIDRLSTMCRYVLGDDVNAHVSDRIGYLMLYQWVDMIRTCGKKNDHAAFVLRSGQHFVIAALECIKVVLLHSDSLRDSVLGGGFVDS